MKQVLRNNSDGSISHVYLTTNNGINYYVSKEARDKSILPDKPNEKKIWKEYKNIVVNFLRNDKRFLNCWLLLIF